MDSTASSFRRDRRNARGSSESAPLAAGSELDDMSGPDAPSPSAPGSPAPVSSALGSSAMTSSGPTSSGPTSSGVSGDTMGWDAEREVVVSASSIPSAAEAAAPPVPHRTAPPPSVPPVSTSGDGVVRLGWDAGQPALATAAAGAAAPAKRGLVSGATVLPEIAEAPAAPRKLWRHPAFIVSMITTVVAIGVAATMLVMAAMNGGPPRVGGLEITAGSGSVALSWTGPDVGYDLYVINGGDITDLSQIVRGRDVWMPRTFGYVDDDSCFVVRATSVDGDVSLSADVLEAQGAASVCMSDADE